MVKALRLASKLQHALSFWVLLLSQYFSLQPSQANVMYCSLHLFGL